MKKISIWAKRHPWAARISIPFLYAAIAALAILMASNLQALQIQISGFLFSLSIIFFFAGVIFYPDKKHKKNFRINFYYRQKICDFLLVFSSFLIVGCVATDPARFLLLPESSRAATLASLPGDAIPVKPAVSDNKKPVLKFVQTRAERKALLKQVKAMLRQSLHKQGEKDPNSATRITLVILSIIGGIVLSMLLIVLACNIACTGSGSLALFVAFFGAAAIAALLVLAIRGIFHRYPKMQTFRSHDGRGRPA